MTGTEEKLALAQTAYRELYEYDGNGSLMGAIAELWCEIKLGMSKAPMFQKDIDGVLPNGRSLQVKAKRHGAHRDSQTYVSMREGHSADDLVIVFIDRDGEVKRTVGPVAVAELKPRKGRCYVSHILEEIASRRTASTSTATCCIRGR